MVNDVSMSSFSLKSQLCSQTLIIMAAGYLNRAGGEAIARIYSHPVYARIAKVILVLEKVPVVNTIGLSYVSALLEQLKVRGGGLVLVKANPGLIRTFNIMGIYSHAFKADTLQEALELLSS